MSKTVESFIEHWMAPCGCGGAECNECNAIRALMELVGSLEKERNGAQSKMFHALNSRDALVEALKLADSLLGGLLPSYDKRVQSIRAALKLAEPSPLNRITGHKTERNP